MVEVGNSSSRPSLPIRFSTDDLLERDRFAIFREMIGRSILNFDVTPRGEEAFRWNLTMRSLPDAAVVNMESTPYELTRGRAQVGDGDDNFTVGIVRSSGMLVRQEGREVHTSAGSAWLWSNERAGTAHIQAGAVFQSIAIPRRILAPMVPHLEDAVMSSVPHHSAGLRLLTSYASALLDETLELSAELGAQSAIHIQDLVAVTVGASRDATEIAKGRGVRVARLQAIRADIEANLLAPNLSLERLSRRHGISPRYVRALFDGEGTSFTDYVLGRRLLRAHRALSNPASEAKISTIAFEAGFGDLSYFNQAFRRHFGMTPSDARARARSAASGRRPA